MRSRNRFLLGVGLLLAVCASSAPPQARGPGRPPLVGGRVVRLTPEPAVLSAEDGLRRARADFGRPLAPGMMLVPRGGAASSGALSRVRLRQELGGVPVFRGDQLAVVGPEGLALRAELLDGELANDELYPDGILLIGADRIELAFVAPSGRTGDEPTRRRERIGKERLARSVAQLEQSSEQMARTDRDLRYEPDARRDQYFERARLGVGGEVCP